MRLLRDCDVIVDIKINGKTLIGVRGDGSQITVPLNLEVPAIDLVTRDQAGLMSVSDKVKLDAINDQAVGVSYVSEVNSGTKLGTLIVGNTKTAIYAPVYATHTTQVVAAMSDGKTLVSYAAIISSGTKLGTLIVDDKQFNIFAPAAPDVPAVSYTAAVKSGIRLGTLTIGSTPTEIYAPAFPEIPVVPTITYTPIVTTGTKLGTLKVGSAETAVYAPAASSAGVVTYTPIVTTGTKIGVLKAGAEETAIYAPAASQQTITKAAVTNALGFTPISTSVVPDAMAPGDNYTDISTSGAAAFAGDYKELKYSPPSNGYCTITGKKSVRICDYTNGLDANSFSSATDANYGASATLPVRKGHDIRFYWHVDAETVSEGLDRFRLRFIPST